MTFCTNKCTTRHLEIQALHNSAVRFLPITSLVLIPTFITAKSLTVGVDMMPLIFSKQLNVNEIVIDSPEITLLRNQAGVWNFSSLGNGEKKTDSSSGSSNLSVGKLELTGGKREEAARMLGIGERTLYRVIKDWDLQDQIKKALDDANGDVAANFGSA